MIIRFAILLLLCSASLPLLAAEEHAAAQDEGGCPPMVDEHEAPDGTGARDGDPDAASSDEASRPPRGGGDEAGVRGPRMHNLLPGMFR